MGYQIREQEQYIITGREGKEYKIPMLYGLSIDEFGIMLRYNETDDPLEKIKISKEFFLTIAPELEDEKIGDVEYFNIFQDYNEAKPPKMKKRVGES